MAEAPAHLELRLSCERTRSAATSSVGDEIAACTLSAVPVRSPRVTNRERIVATALRLFDARGYAAVSTNHIAEDLGISPGNLYYHFRSKEQIAEVIYDEMIERVRATTALPAGDLAPAAFAEYYTSAAETLWRYRFIYGDLEELVRRSPRIAREHRRLMKATTQRVVEVFERLGAEGKLTGAPAAETLALVATNTTVVLTSWWRHLITAYPPSRVTARHLRLAASHGFALIEPYVEPAFGAQVRQAIERSTR